MNDNTPSGPRLPSELCLWIIDIIFISELSSQFFSSNDDQRVALSTLWACALTCRSWRDRAQYLLFHVIQLRSVRALRSLIDVIRASPRLGTYVVQITLFHDYPNSTDSATAAFPAPLRSCLPRLQVIKMFSLRSETVGKATSLPLHQRFPGWLASFHTVTTFVLSNTAFASFGTFLRLVNAFPNLTRLDLLEGIRWHTVGRLPPFMTTVSVAGQEVGGESLSSRRRHFLPHLQGLLIAEPWPQEELQAFFASLQPSLEGLWLSHPLFRARLPEVNVSDVDGGIAADIETPPTPPPFISLAHLKSLNVYGVYMQPGADSPRHLASLSNTLHGWLTPESRRRIAIMPWRHDGFTRNDFLSALVRVGSQLEDMVFVSLAPQTEHTSESVPVEATVRLRDKRERWDEWHAPVAACFPRLFDLGAVQTTLEYPGFPMSMWQDCDSAAPLRLPPEHSEAPSDNTYTASGDPASTAANATEKT